jgi:hypothetical protein
VGISLTWRCALKIILGEELLTGAQVEMCAKFGKPEGIRGFLRVVFIGHKVELLPATGVLTVYTRERPPKPMVVIETQEITSVKD